MKNDQERDCLTFHKRISKLSSAKVRPNSSFGIPSTNYTINSLKGERSLSMRKSREVSKYNQLNRSCFFNRNYNSKSQIRCNSALDKKRNSKILYEDSIKLKTKINKLRKELLIMKSDNVKKSEEIKKRKREIISCKAREKTYDNLKEENTISKLKDNYEFLRNKTKKMKENNNKLLNDLKTRNLFFQEQENENNLILLKEKIIEYNNSLQQNSEFDNQIYYTHFNREEFFYNHNYIEGIQRQIDDKNKKIFLMRENLYQLKENFNKVEQERQKMLSYNKSLEKRNEKLLIEKKKREDFILQKPVILRKINEYEKKAKGIEDENRKNESEIEKLSNTNKMMIKQLKESQIPKPMDYNKIITIERNPNNNIDQRIVLLQSLIKESKDRQNEFIEIFEYYDDYVQQKEKYEIINDEAKMIEEKNLLNMNNNQNIDDNKNNNIDDSNFEEKKNIEKDSGKKEENNINEINNLTNALKEKNIQKNIDEDKSQRKEKDMLNNSPSSINSKNKEKFDENENVEEKSKKRKKKINQMEIKENEKEKDNNKEKKYKTFQFLLSIIFLNQGLKKEEIEQIILEENSYINEDEYLSNLSKNILSLIDDKNEKDMETLQKIFKYQLKNNYSNDVEIFKAKIIPDFLEKNKFTLVQTEEDENQYLAKMIQIYGPCCNSLLEKLKNFQKDETNLISYKDLKKILKEENIYSKNDKEKINIFKFFIFVLKKNSSFQDENASINDFFLPDIINFIKGITDIISGKKIESEDLNEDDDGLTITDEEFKKILNNFLNDLNQKIEEKKIELNELLGEHNIREIEKDGKNMKIMDIYKFVETLKENGINLIDSLVISCIFNRYQINENSEDINISALQRDLEQKQIVFEN